MVSLQQFDLAKGFERLRDGSLLQQAELYNSGQINKLIYGGALGKINELCRMLAPVEHLNPKIFELINDLRNDLKF